eukprot:s620_g19.t1
MQQAWDLAFMWGSFEPVSHHVAMPVQILTAFLATALTWGWAREAAIFALAWGALQRIGEVLQAKRSDLTLPQDVGGTIQYALLRIWEPKTRYRAARHQCGKLEQPDLIEVIRIGLGYIQLGEKLWPFSGATLRLRFSKIAMRLLLPSRSDDTPKPMSLASFRPGGATHLITTTESAELVRRRGRWISNKVMECYLQEVESTTYLNEVSEACRARILKALAVFPLLLRQIRLPSVAGRESEMARLKRSIADVRAKWAQQKNLYEDWPRAVRTDKNLYSKNLVESLEEINEMRKKFKVMCHQIEQLKEEIKEKDVRMIEDHSKHVQISKETEKTRHSVENQEKQLTKAQQVVEQQQADIKKLEATIQEAETERQNQRKEFEAVTSERNILGKQLIRRNEELSLIYEKIKIQESTLSKGEAQYKKLLDGLHGQRGDIGELKRDLYIARQQAESAGSLEKEVYHLQRELLQERTKVRALSEELENPMNVHRWRKLEGSDPAMYELIQKVRSLQKRLIAKTEEVVVKDIEIQEKDKLHKELNGILEKQPGPEVLEQLEQYQDTYAAKQKQMKAMQSELHTYQSQVSDYKDEIDRLNRELQEVKKKFYDQKKREMIQQDQRCLGGPMGRQSCHSSPTCAAGSLYGRIVQLGTLRSPVSLKSIYEFGRERR